MAEYYTLEIPNHFYEEYGNKVKSVCGSLMEKMMTDLQTAFKLKAEADMDNIRKTKRTEIKVCMKTGG